MPIPKNNHSSNDLGYHPQPTPVLPLSLPPGLALLLPLLTYQFLLCMLVDLPELVEHILRCLANRAVNQGTVVCRALLLPSPLLSLEEISSLC